MRPCGKLDRYEAVGQLIGDALGLPLVPQRPYALAMGNKAQKLEKEKLPGEMEKAKKAARKKHEDAEEAAAAVLLQTVTMTLPTPEQCTAGTAAPVPTPEPAPAPEPALEPEPELDADTSTRIRWVVEMEDACRAALDAEAAHREFDELSYQERDSEDDDYFEAKLQLEMETKRYRRALQKLARAMPQLELRPDQWAEGLSAHHSCLAHATRLCRCRSGDRVGLPGYIRPWYLQTESLGFCQCIAATADRRSEREAIM